MPLFWFLLLLELHSIPCLTSSSSSSAIKKLNCKDHCGNVRIPYPFGIGANCYHDPWYEIVCNSSFHPPKAFLQRYNLEVTQISWPDSNRGPNDITPLDPQTLTVHIPVRNICTSTNHAGMLIGRDLRGSPYSFSPWYNVLHVEGCSGSVVLKSKSGKTIAGCASLCTNTKVDHISKTANCYGAGCCQAFISYEYDYIDYYDIGLNNASLTSLSSSCNLIAALVDSNSTEKVAHFGMAPAVLQWNATYLTTNQLRHSSYSCDDDLGRGPQLCQCGFGYIGNPFLPNGCQIVPECRKCRHDCVIFFATSRYGCSKDLWLKRVKGFSSGAGSAFLILVCYWMFRLIRRKREIKRKQNYFKRNGGLLMQQQLSSRDGVVEKITIFTVSDLEKATDSFHQNRVLGQGGQGTVYKGMLMDGSTVAIKKSVKVDQGQLDQFVNEVVILSQINHRNVVKLLGCCLETEVPLLVYEFIPNGTLYQHIHDPSEDFHLSWKMRLRIAAESAGALAYLHSSSIAPIYHRDIKSSNILLDEKFRAKVSDFGTSRAINIEQTHVTTRVQGTYGYLDPQYFQSNQFTEKSDVYSFGVVLVELITGKKPISPTDSGGWKSLAVEFLSHMENSHLFDIVDTNVIEEAKEEELTAVAELAKKCLNMNGRQRPTMKEVAMALDRIMSPNSREQTSTDPGKYCMVTEIDDIGPSCCSTDMFFSNDGSCSSSSMEVQPLTDNAR